jgi:hypothetical protein
MTHWYAKLDAYYYFDEQQPWEGDFSYSFGYEDWTPYTLSVVYENQMANRFRPDRAAGEYFTHYLEGYYTFGWKFLLADTLAKPMLLDLKQNILCRAAYVFTPRYSDTLGNLHKHKQAWSLNCNYPIYDAWYFSVNLFYYPDPGQQQPWDADYTYEFGYAGWLPGGFSLQYKNYAGNRYPWNDTPGSGGFSSGGLYVSWNWKW